MLLWLFSFLLGTPTIYPLNGRGAKMARIRRNFYRRTDKKVSPKNLQSDVRAVQKGVVAGGATDGQ